MGSKLSFIKVLSKKGSARRVWAADSQFFLIKFLSIFWLFKIYGYLCNPNLKRHTAEKREGSGNQQVLF
ncbi:hypothetical protein A3860_35295 [Niastella vici]|uniref:Uncharacterized protein n=1 Tax=Niastella vici TaxID=1703345 RepID=A0A1V9FNU4_9BACT|nr:hypothetical protein A3860_35295 [Niastella vici]